jgi:hypothetical protein
MIEFVCGKKSSEETQGGTKYEVWFNEKGRVRLDRSGKLETDAEWKRYEVTAEQYAALRVGQSYKLAPW